MPWSSIKFAGLGVRNADAQLERRSLDMWWLDKDVEKNETLRA